MSLTKLSFDEDNTTRPVNQPDTHQTAAYQDTSASQTLDTVFAAQDNMARRVLNPELMALRHQLPFVSIMPIPMKCLFIVAAKANDVGRLLILNAVRRMKHGPQVPQCFSPAQ